MVLVHRFRALDRKYGVWMIRPIKMTAEAVEAAGGTVLPGTEEYVDPSQLDDRGQYHMPRRT